MIIGLTGTLAAGKDTLADYLCEQGFTHISLSQILRKMATSEGISITLENLTKLGNSIEEKYGPGYLAKKALEEIKQVKGDSVISSIRQPSEIDFLKSVENFYLVFVDADPKVRFERLKERGRQGDSKNLEDFIKTEKKQMDGKSGGMNLSECKKLADYVIQNDSTKENFIAEFEGILNEIRERAK